ncbi:hypothetical protein DQ384_39190 [Sphaerisporangium album]|uniref:Uncharacterized protein n=1 Tax=Sphaerisporangium album TaxID=509200 RepID=A0A367EKH6_9ACTN|nr:hypothetical protein [Sphaerisporangium album]RCG18222.1 hypothetical protein DQ384_39190 [Sphaerisporangium album]
MTLEEWNELQRSIDFQNPATHPQAYLFARDVDQQTARHVLWYLNRMDRRVPTGLEPGAFTQRLMDLIHTAHPTSRAKLALGFPEYVAAYHLSDIDFTAGVKILTHISGLHPEPTTP